MAHDIQIPKGKVTSGEANTEPSMPKGEFIAKRPIALSMPIGQAVTRDTLRQLGEHTKSMIV